MNIRILTFSATLFLVISCKKEIPCVETCGWQQECTEGECKCPEGHYQIDQWCKERRDGYYFGSLNCDCYGQFVVSLALLENDRFQLLYGIGSSSTDVIVCDNETYKATFSESCNFDGSFAQFVDFTVVKISDNEIDVHTRWWNIENGTLAECEGVFTH